MLYLENYKDTITEIERRLLEVIALFSGTPVDSTYLVTPQYKKDKNMIIFKINNLTDKTRFTIFQKPGLNCCIKFYDENDDLLYEFYQKIQDNVRISYLFYGDQKTHLTDVCASRFGILEKSTINPISQKYMPISLQKVTRDDNDEVLFYSLQSQINGATIFESSIPVICHTNDMDIPNESASQDEEKKEELAGIYYLFDSTSLSKDISTFGKTYISFQKRNNYPPTPPTNPGDDDFENR